MSGLRLQSASLRRGSRELLHEADLIVQPGWRLGLVGANGVGKSSLFALIRGEIELDGGDFRLPPNTAIAHVAQEIPALECSALDYALDGDSELREIQALLAVAEDQGDAGAIAQLHERLHAIDAYTAVTRAARLLSGLGFAHEDMPRAVNTFSGGWRMRLNLAQALMMRSDLLLLDEPTNHLDLDAVFWLEEWLRAYPGTLVLISHDREFLDAVVNRVAHMENQAIELYTGDYSDFERQRAARLATRAAEVAKQKREREHMESFVARFRAKASKARQAQSRLKALQRMQVISEAHVDSPFQFRFRECEAMPNPLLRLEQTAIGYGETPLLSGVNLILSPGDRIGLLGHNGAGKSTLVKLLAGEHAPMAGARECAKDLRIGYFAQHQLEQLRPADSPLEHLQPLAPNMSEQQLRDFLGGFGFGDRAASPVAPFSGGEKARLVLAMLVLRKPNLLLLDEPTNHLDLDMRHALTVALQEFEGALVVVAHDRFLLRSVADELLLVDGGRVAPFDGDIDTYRDWLMKPRDTADGLPGAGETPGDDGVSRKQQRRDAAERRKALQPLRKKLQACETRLEKLEVERAGLQAALAESDIYEPANKSRLHELLQREAELRDQLEQAEMEWLQAGEAVEAAESGET